MIAVAAAVAAVMGMAGFYTLIAVYRGWPLPPTASQRRASRSESVR